MCSFGLVMRFEEVFEKRINVIDANLTSLYWIGANLKHFI